MKLLWAVCKFLRINNIDLKCSFVRCRKYHKSWWNGAAKLHISVDLLCGTTAAETFERWTFWKIQLTQIDSKLDSKLFRYVRFTKIQQTFKRWTLANALRRQNTRPQQTLEWWTPRTHESPRELVRQSEAKRKQTPQSEANREFKIRRLRTTNYGWTSVVLCL